MTRLTVKEAAVYLSCSVSTLNKLRVRGGGPPFSKRTGKVLYDAANLDRWWSEGKQRSTSERPKRRGRPPRQGGLENEQR
jgi:excisionase family DNA binding protein